MQTQIAPCFPILTCGAVVKGLPAALALGVESGDGCRRSAAVCLIQLLHLQLCEEVIHVWPLVLRRRCPSWRKRIYRIARRKWIRRTARRKRIYCTARRKRIRLLLLHGLPGLLGGLLLLLLGRRCRYLLRQLPGLLLLHRLHLTLRPPGRSRRLRRQSGKRCGTPF